MFLDSELLASAYGNLSRPDIKSTTRLTSHLSYPHYSVRKVAAHSLQMTTTFDDNKLIKVFYHTVTNFRDIYLANDDKRYYITESKQERYRRLSPYDRQYYRLNAARMMSVLEQVLHWTSDIDKNLGTGDINGETLPDIDL
jgi:hypothetical protein